MFCEMEHSDVSLRCWLSSDFIICPREIQQKGGALQTYNNEMASHMQSHQCPHGMLWYESCTSFTSVTDLNWTHWKRTAIQHFDDGSMNPHVCTRFHFSDQKISDCKIPAVNKLAIHFIALKWITFVRTIPFLQVKCYFCSLDDKPDLWAKFQKVQKHHVLF